MELNKVPKKTLYRDFLKDKTLLNHIFKNCEIYTMLFITEETNI